MEFNASALGDYRLFVLHDADPYGYNIARTLQEETDRMPGYNVDVKDLGLKLEEALDLGLPLEQALRKKKYPQGLSLTPLEREYFDGECIGVKQYKYHRVELDAFTVPDLIEYTEGKLRKKGIRGKVIPPVTELPKLAKPILHELAYSYALQQIQTVISARAIADRVAESFVDSFPLKESHQWIQQGLVENPLAPWDGVLKEKGEALLSEQGASVNEAIVKALREVAETDL